MLAALRVEAMARAEGKQLRLSGLVDAWLRLMRAYAKARLSARSDTLAEEA